MRAEPNEFRAHRLSHDVSSLGKNRMCWGNFKTPTITTTGYAGIHIKDADMRKMGKKCDTLLDLCVSSLRRGHANLLCIVPIKIDDSRRESLTDNRPASWTVQE